MKMAPKNVILMSIGIVLSSGLGVGVGYVLSNFFPHVVKEVKYDYDENYLKADSDACLKKFEKFQGSEKAFDGKSLAGWEIINASLKKFENQENNMSQGIGYAKARVGPIDVMQQIRSTMYRVGDSYFEESLSKSSVVNVAWRMYQEGEITKRYKGGCPSNVEKPVFASDASPTVYSESEYFEHAGRNLDGSSCIYLISDKTLSSDNQKATSGLPENEISKNEDGTFTIDLELDPRKSVVNYIRQMKATTDMNGNPIFDYVHISFTVTKDGDLVSSTSNEKYFASTPSGSSNLEGQLVTHYSTGGNYAIPELNTPIVYENKN